jgi:hypothetical protein
LEQYRILDVDRYAQKTYFGFVVVRLRVTVADCGEPELYGTFCIRYSAIHFS